MITMEPRPTVVCPKCHNREHLDGARFCMVCGISLSGCEGCANEKSSRDMDCCWSCSRNPMTTRRDLFRHRTPAGGETYV